MNRVTACTCRLACACVIASWAPLSEALQFDLREKPLTNITTPQASVQVVSPEVYREIGEQSRAITDDDKRFNALDERLNGFDKALDKLEDRIKPIEDTNLTVKLIIHGIEALFGILVATGGVTWGLDFLKRRRGRSIEPKA